MKNIKSLKTTTLIFGLMGILGPCIRWLTWSFTSPTRNGGGDFEGFIQDLVFLLWPTQSFAVMEINTGPIVAGAVAVGVNVLLFFVLGVLADFFRGDHRLIICYALLALLLVVFSLWGAGFSFAYLNWIALACALVLYVIPFVATKLLVRKGNGS